MAFIIYGSAFLSDSLMIEADGNDKMCLLKESSHCLAFLVLHCYYIPSLILVPSVMYLCSQPGHLWLIENE
nr:hypothetical protein Itr_chr15CG13630 [Ipomoea trifida]GMD07854.1 hypothetical protein Iba_chr06cCG11150 [Ipomoea batatas]